jgi:hypothetical protein
VHGEVLGTKLSVSLNTEEPVDTSVTEARETIDISPTPSSEDADQIQNPKDGDEDATKSKRRLDQSTEYLRQACCSLINQMFFF